MPTRKNLSPDEVEELRALVQEAQREIRELIAFLQAKLEGQQPQKA